MSPDKICHLVIQVKVMVRAKVKVRAKAKAQVKVKVKVKVTVVKKGMWRFSPSDLKSRIPSELMQLLKALMCLHFARVRVGRTIIFGHPRTFFFWGHMELLLLKWHDIVLSMTFS